MAAKISKKKVESKVERLFNDLGKNIQFNLMDLGKIARPVEDLLLAGGTDEAATDLMNAQIAKYRQN